MKTIAIALMGAATMAAISIMSGLQCNKSEPAEIIFVDSIRHDTSMFKPSPHEPTVKTYYVKDRDVIIDTLRGGDKIIIYPKDSIAFGFVEIRAVLDSIGGSPNGTAIFERSQLGLSWKPMLNERINGSTTQNLSIIEPFYGKFKCTFLMFSGTMVEVLNFQYREHETPQR